MNDKVRKCLLFHNVLMSEIRDGVSRTDNKRALAQFVSGKLLKKYRVMHMTKVFGSRRLLQLNRNNRMKRKSAVSSELIRHIQQFYLREDNSSSTAGKKETITRKMV